MAGCSEKMPTNNRWAWKPLISKEVPVAEVDSCLKDLDEINYVTCLTFNKIFKNKDSLPKDKVQDIIEKIKIEYLAYLEEQSENKVLYSLPGTILMI